MSITIILQNTTTVANLPTHKQFQHWIEQTIAAIPLVPPNDANQLTIRIIDKVESALLNRRYRAKQGPTNILAFPDDPIPGFIADSLGDLAICAELVIVEAKEQHKSIEAHWAHLCVHGLLHLLGYNHIEIEDANIMESMEINILSILGYPNPY